MVVDIVAGHGPKGFVPLTVKVVNSPTAVRGMHAKKRLPYCKRIDSYAGADVTSELSRPCLLVRHTLSSELPCLYLG